MEKSLGSLCLSKIQPRPQGFSLKKMGKGKALGTRLSKILICNDFPNSKPGKLDRNEMNTIENIMLQTSLPADVLWGSFVTYSFLPHFSVGEK